MREADLRLKSLFQRMKSVAVKGRLKGLMEIEEYLLLEVKGFKSNIMYT